MSEKELSRANAPKDVVILGIDPGTTVMGYGVIRASGKRIAGMEVLGVLELQKYSDHYIKLSVIYERVQQLVEQYLPDEVAIEAPFFGKNVQSMLKLGRAQGVAIAAVLSRRVPIFEYAPREIKQAITGNGAASKEQVARMLSSILRVADFGQKYYDATDGLAAAVCHCYQRTSPLGGAKGGKSWADFVRKNQGRVSGL